MGSLVGSYACESPSPAAPVPEDTWRQDQRFGRRPSGGESRSAGRHVRRAVGAHRPTSRNPGCRCGSALSRLDSIKAPGRAENAIWRPVDCVRNHRQGVPATTGTASSSVLPTIHKRGLSRGAISKARPHRLDPSVGLALASDSQRLQGFCRFLGTPEHAKNPRRSLRRKFSRPRKDSLNPPDHTISSVSIRHAHNMSSWGEVTGKPRVGLSEATRIAPRQLPRQLSKDPSHGHENRSPLHQGR